MVVIASGAPEIPIKEGLVDPHPQAIWLESVHGNTCRLISLGAPLLLAEESIINSKRSSDSTLACACHIKLLEFRYSGQNTADSTDVLQAVRHLCLAETALFLSQSGQ